jgi:threonine dehydrogenase-like Zn-dependent dehydrogenase
MVEGPLRRCDALESVFPRLLDRIERGEMDPSRVITHRLPLAEAPHGYDIFKNKEEHCEKVVLTP